MDYSLFLLRIISAAIAPGTHPHNVSSVVIMTDPQPLSNTASGGNKMHKRTLKHDINLSLLFLAKVVNTRLFTKKLGSHFESLIHH